IDIRNRLYQVDPNDEESYTELLTHFLRERDSANLVRLYTRRVDTRRDDYEARNNLALLSLLQNLNLGRAFTLAQDSFRHDRANPYYRTTYAFALLRQNRAGEALEIIEAIPTNQLREPNRALYYAAILAANERAEDARAYLGLVRPENLFPDEQRLHRTVQLQIEQLRN
ncbi:MAG: hypothetical protein EA425_00235, partial [Puniceicoccaceae bacterium]